MPKKQKSRKAEPYSPEGEFTQWKLILELILAAARALVDYRKRVGPLNFQLEKADDYIRAMGEALDALERLMDRHGEPSSTSSERRSK